MKNNNVLWKIAGLVIIIAVVSSLATMALTGNVVSITKPSAEVSKCTNDCSAACVKTIGVKDAKGLSACKSACRTTCNLPYKVYSTDEVDAKLKGLSTGTSNFGECSVVYSSREFSCGQICLSEGGINTNCVSGLFTAGYIEVVNSTSIPGNLESKVTPMSSIISCSQDPKLLLTNTFGISVDKLSDIDMACMCC